MPKNSMLTFSDAFKQLSESLRTQANRPNLLGYEPHEKQHIFHSSTSKKKLYIGGNRSGKTTGGIVEDLYWASGRHPYRETPKGGVRGRIVSVDFINGINKIIIPELKRWCVTSDLRGGSWDTAYDKFERVLNFANGSFIELMSYDQDLDKFAGTSRHFVHFDEEPPQDIFTENTARLVDTGGSYWITMTPVEGMTWVYDTIYEPGISEDSGITVVEVSMTENPHLDSEAVQDFLDSLDPDERKAREKGQFVQLGGLVYKSFDTSMHVSKSGWRPSKDHLVVCSLDHGFHNPTAALWHAVSQDGEVVTFYEHYVSGQTVPWHAAQINRINQEVLNLQPDLYIADPSIRNTQPISGTSIHLEYLTRGIPFTLGNNDVVAGINRVSQYLKLRNGKPMWVITEDCPNLIKEMRRYRWKTYASKKVANANNLQEEPHKKDDHACDAARYFFMSRPDLRAEAPTGGKQPNSRMDASVITGEPLTATGPAAPRAYGDYSDTQWTTDEMGTEW